MANRIEKIEKLCNPKLSWEITRLGLTIKYTGFGDLWLTDGDTADHCTPEEAINVLEGMITKIKKHSGITE